MKYTSIGRTTEIGRNRWERAKYHALMNHNRRTCEICGRNAPDADGHHAIVKRKKGSVAVDGYWNLEMVCRTCHDKVAHTKANKIPAMENALRYNSPGTIMRGLKECKDEGLIVDEQIRMLRQLVKVVEYCPICFQELSTGNLERGERICDECR